MPDRPATYDPRFCEIQDKLLEETIARVQRLVDEYHGNNVALAQLKGQLETLTARVPVDLPQQITMLTVKHDGLHKDFSLLRGQVYALVGAILLSGVGAFMAWVLRGGLR